MTDNPLRIIYDDDLTQLHVNWSIPEVTNRDVMYLRPSNVAGFVDFDPNTVGDEPSAFYAPDVIAIANAASEPERKVTRECVENFRLAIADLRELRDEISATGAGCASDIEELERLANIIDLYLPPT